MTDDKTFYLNRLPEYQVLSDDEKAFFLQNLGIAIILELGHTYTPEQLDIITDMVLAFYTGVEYAIAKEAISFDNLKYEELLHVIDLSMKMQLSLMVLFTEMEELLERIKVKYNL